MEVLKNITDQFHQRNLLSQTVPSSFPAADPECSGWKDWTQKRSWISQHILTCKLRSKIFNKSRTLRGNWTFIGYMIDTFRCATSDVGQKVGWKVEAKKELVTVSDIRETDLSIMAFWNRYFAAQCLKDVHSNHGRNVCLKKHCM